MKYISSQHYLDADIVNEKIEMLQAEGVESVEIPFADAGEIDGEEYAVQLDGHHTLAAAMELGLKVVFTVSEDPEGLTGMELIEARYLDGDYYDVETSNPMEDKFDLIW